MFRCFAPARRAAQKAVCRVAHHPSGGKKESARC
uniref:Uncharacterized protein n=1 Tax=Arundo donax TaxID=35708 RepID=A0A0A9F1G7_ARUDO